MNLVPGIGPPDAKIMLIGESWGHNEALAYARSGRHTPFCGAAGELLDKLMLATGISRSNIYITNVIREQPPNNDASCFIRFGRDGAATYTPEYKIYERYLYDEICSVKPNVLVPTGNIPLYALVGKTAITKRRGSILEAQINGNKFKVIPTIHPAAALRQYIFSHFIAYDLRRIVEESKTPDINLPQRKLRIKPSFHEAISYMRAVKDVVAFDIEVVNEEISCFSLAVDALDAMSIPLRSHGNDYFTPEQEAAIWLELARICQDPSILKIGQNIVFDATFIFRKLGIRVEPVADTMVACAIAYPDFPKGLDFITSIWTREPYYKDEGKKWFKLGGSEETFFEYNAKDAAVCFEAFPKLMAELERQDNTETYVRQASLISPLVYMQERGIKVDTNGLREASEKAALRIEELNAELTSLCGYQLNPNSPKQLADYFYIKKGHKPYVSRKTGSITTDIDALKRLARKGFREASILLETRKLAKLKGTYFDMHLDGDGRIRCAFNPVGTKTGRLSSSKTIFGTGGNMQNLPPTFQQYIQADEGSLIYNIDLSQAENRIVAYIAPEPAMIAAFERGIDIHSQTASLIFSKPIDAIKQEDKDQVKCPLGTGAYTMRFWGKKSNHSFNYDLGYKAFAILAEMSEREAKILLERYHHVYPGVRRYHAWIRTKLSKDRTLENLLGRKRVFRERWGDELFKEAYAFIPQSSVADIINERGVRFIYYNQSLFRPVDLLNQVHDAIAFQMSHKDFSWLQHAEVLLRLRDSLQAPLAWRGMEFSIPVDLSVGLTMNKKTMSGVKINEFSEATGLARRLSEVYEEQRTSHKLQDVGSDIGDSELLEEENSAELGDLDVLS